MQGTEFEIVPAKPAIPAVEVLSGDVGDDEHAIRIFLDSYARKSAHTVRSYEKECYRFLLWLKATRDPSPAMLPAVAVQDINDYLTFLANPRPFAESFLKAHGWEHQPFRKALVVSLLNPKAIAFLLSFFIQFVDPAYAHPALTFLILGTIIQVLSFVYLSTLIFAGARLAAAFRARRKLASTANAGVGALFVGFGAKLATATL